VAGLSCRASERGPNSSDAPLNRVADDAAIRAVFAMNEAASNRRDFDGVAGTFTPDADIWFASLPRISGRDAIRRNEEEYWSKAPSTRRISMTVDAIRYVATDVAIADTTLVSPGESRELGTAIMVHRDGVWRIAAVRVLFVERL
jgi:uncharacterized protein (TIGR02246 family)